MSGHQMTDARWSALTGDRGRGLVPEAAAGNAGHVFPCAVSGEGVAGGQWAPRAPPLGAVVSLDGP